MPLCEAVKSAGPRGTLCAMHAFLGAMQDDRTSKAPFEAAFDEKDSSSITKSTGTLRTMQCRVLLTVEVQLLVSILTSFAVPALPEMSTNSHLISQDDAPRTFPESPVPFPHE